MRSRIRIARDTLSVSCSHPDAAVDPSESSCPPKMMALSSLFPVPSRCFFRRRMLCAAATAIGCRNWTSDQPDVAFRVQGCSICVADTLLHTGTFLVREYLGENS